MKLSHYAFPSTGAFQTTKVILAFTLDLPKASLEKNCI